MGGAGGRGEACRTMQIVQNGESVQSRPVLPCKDATISSGLRPLPHATFSFSWLPFERLAASILAPLETVSALGGGHPGGPWEKQAGHEGVRNRILIDFA